MGPDHDPHSVLIVSEVRLLREGLAEALGRGSQFSIAGQCASAEQASAEIAASRPDAVVLDASLQGGIDWVRKVRAFDPQLRVVVLAVAETVETVTAWAKAGVAGYIPKTAGLAEAGAMLLGILEGEQVCSRSVAAGLLQSLRAHGTAGSRDTMPPPGLTVRETQIIELISAGMSNKDIARRLNIGVATTKSHVHNLLTKLQVQRRGQAALRMRYELR
jgi:DNA-binding NarL/FixJ family response regulator